MDVSTVGTTHFFFQNGHVPVHIQITTTKVAANRYVVNVTCRLSWPEGMTITLNEENHMSLHWSHDVQSLGQIERSILLTLADNVSFRFKTQPYMFL